ncbi:MAG: AAA domain-containing protein [Streptosporangiales bacterium]|nr:AAA domain-containing protein [Streptosporangiales bacterium]
MSDAQRSGEATLLDAVLREVKRVIVGQDRVIERLLVCLLAQGHALLEGLPGLAKTLAAETLSTTVGGKFARIQFTPDLLPADIMGTRIYRQSTESFDVELGPVFVNFLLADEINRAPAKVQSALLEVMAEHQVSIGGTTYPVPEPFLVLATQNPIEQEGVYPLPEAQSDRFLMKILVPYPHPLEEVEIVERMGVNPPRSTQVLDLEQLVTLQQAVKQVRVDRPVLDYAVTLVLATRDPDRYGLEELKPLITCGASPRASLGLISAGRALALLRGRDFLVPQDVYDVGADVLRHRMVLSYEALAQNLGADEVVAKVLQGIGLPRLSGQTPVGGVPQQARPNGAQSAGPPPQHGEPRPVPPPYA